MLIEKESVRLLQAALGRLNTGFDQLPEYTPAVDMESVSTVLMEVAERMQDNYPYPHPLYAGQMMKPPHPIARLAYALTLWINPNNHALDGGRRNRQDVWMDNSSGAPLQRWNNGESGSALGSRQSKSRKESGSI